MGARKPANIHIWSQNWNLLLKNVLVTDFNDSPVLKTNSLVFMSLSTLLSYIEKKLLCAQNVYYPHEDKITSSLIPRSVSSQTSWTQIQFFLCGNDFSTKQSLCAWKKKCLQAHKSVLKLSHRVLNIEAQISLCICVTWNKLDMCVYAHTHTHILYTLWDSFLCRCKYWICIAVM